jgi:hypothetical protein
MECNETKFALLSLYAHARRETSAKYCITNSKGKRSYYDLACISHAEDLNKVKPYHTGRDRLYLAFLETSIFHRQIVFLSVIFQISFS